MRNTATDNLNANSRRGASNATKRLIDLGASVVLLALALPLMVACAVWVKCVDGGPVLYRQWRVGRDGWLFRIYKLRTMALDAEEPGAARFARDGDSRVLRGCGWMRKSHADELPQLWNVIRGEMSLVGPRPERPEMLEELRRHLPRIERRLSTRPGLTGLAQVRNGYTNDVAGARRKLALDLRYLRQQNPWNDFVLLLQTIPKVWDKAAL